MKEEINNIKPGLNLGMSLNQLEALLGPAKSHIGPYYVWERPEGRYELTVQNGKLFSMNSVPDVVAEPLRKASSGKDLSRAADDGDLDAINELLDHGADVDARDRSGNTALLVAVCYGNTEAVELLCSRGADVNVVGEGGYTPLRMAGTTSKQRELERILRSHGAV